MTLSRRAVVTFMLVALSGMANWSGAASMTISPGRAALLDAGFFGIHLHRLQLKPGERAIPTAWPDGNFGMLRLWDSGVGWFDLEPEQGLWKFGRMDRYVQAAHDQGAGVLYTFGLTPKWASARPNEPCSYGKGCAAEPASLAAWREYVRVVARRYRGKICCYELWNEPKFPPDIGRDRNVSSFYTGSVKTLVEMARIAREVLTAEDPAAKLFGPGFVNGTDRLDLFLAAGGARYVQGIAYHFYAWNDEKRMLDEIGRVRAVMRKHGLQHLPLWSTESGVEVHPLDKPLPGGIKSRITREEAAAYLVRQLVLKAFSGIGTDFYYAWDNDNSGMVDRAGRPHPAREAMLKAQRWLLGAKLDRCEISDGRPTVCWGEKEAKPFAITWMPTGDGVGAVTVPGDMRLVGQELAVSEWRKRELPSAGSRVMQATANPAIYQFERVVPPGAATQGALQ